VLFYYLSDLTRYRPVHFDIFLESKYGPPIESILDEGPRQLSYGLRTLGTRSFAGRSCLGYDHKSVFVEPLDLQWLDFERAVSQQTDPGFFAARRSYARPADVPRLNAGSE
jgi:hypothetical protein